MSRSYLTLCQQMAREMRIPGSGPTTVTGQTGELEKICRYIKDADLDIKRRWSNWNFLWTNYTSASTVVDSNELTENPTDVEQWDLDSFVYNPTADTFAELCYMDYQTYRRNILGTQTSQEPTHFSLKPDGTVVVYPQASEAQTIWADYWATGITFTDDADTSEIPTKHDRIIIVRAKLFYAEAEDAPEIMASALAEHEDLMNILESRYLPDQQDRTMSRSTYNPPIVSVG